jgi:putative transport protein
VVLTRLRRGDIDSLIHPGTVLELGDRIRVLAREEDLKDLEKVFGDSYEHLSHIDLLSFGLGMGLGILCWVPSKSPCPAAFCSAWVLPAARW